MNRLLWILAIFALLVSFSPGRAEEQADLSYLSTAYRQAALTQQITRAVCEISTFKNETDNRDFLRLVVAEIPESDDQDWKNIRFALGLLNEMDGYPDLEIGLITSSAARLFDMLLEDAQAYIQHKTASPYMATYERLLRLDARFQKLTADMCAGLSADRHFEIDQNIDELIFGNLEENILPAPSAGLQSMLVELKEKWEAMRDQTTPDVRIFFTLLNKISQAYQAEYRAGS